MDSNLLGFILMCLLIIFILSVIGYYLIRTEPDPEKPKGSIFGNALWYVRLGRRKKGKNNFSES